MSVPWRELDCWYKQLHLKTGEEYFPWLWNFAYCKSGLPILWLLWAESTRQTTRDGRYFDQYSNHIPLQMTECHNTNLTYPKANAVRVRSNAPNRPVSILSTSSKAAISTERYLACPSAFVSLLLLKYVNETLEGRIYWRERKIRWDSSTATDFHGYISYGSLHPLLARLATAVLSIVQLLLCFPYKQNFEQSFSFYEAMSSYPLYFARWMLYGNQSTVIPRLAKIIRSGIKFVSRNAISCRFL